MGLAPDSVFNLGTFTHRNQAINAGTSITQATLQLIYSFFIDSDPGTSITRTSTFVFRHNETPNGAAPCADGGANNQGVNINGCADNVDPVTNPSTSESFTVGTVNYKLDVTGFNIGNSFWTTERANNTATLQARYTAEENIAPIPLPAAGVMLLTVMAGFGVLSRRKAA